MPNEQPEPKPYPTPGEQALCPFKVAAVYANPNPVPGYDLLCYPQTCALAMNQTNECSIKSAARSLDSLYMWNCDVTAGDTLTRQRIKELSDRLGAILDTLAGTQQALPGLEKHLREALVQDGLAPLERQLGRITAQLERLAPPPPGPDGD